MSLTDLDGVQIGSIVWGTTKRTDGTAAHGGMVIDVGLHDDGRAYVELLEEVPPRECRCEGYFKGAPKPRTFNVARLRRLDVDDIDPASIEEPSAIRMEGWAKKAFLGAVMLPGPPIALAVAGGGLLVAARDFYTERAAS